jgi:transcriptional regulator with XRE-family HTH domain
MAQINVCTPRAQRPANIGERVKKRRKELDLSQARLALDAGIGKRTLQRIEAGELPSANTIWRLERGLRLAPGSLVPGWEIAASLHLGSIGARLRKRRQACGLSLKFVGEWIGISASSLSRFERGIPRIADFWDDSLDDRLPRILGFHNVEHFEEWLRGGCNDPPTSYG